MTGISHWHPALSKFFSSFGFSFIHVQL
jgi:hypothetical protein